MALNGQRTKAGERARAAILGATLRLPGRAGPDAFSASTLAKDAGVSKATLFHHFGSIEEIALAAFEQFWLQTLGPDSRKLVSARDYLEELGQHVIVSVQKHGELLRAQVVFVTKAAFDSRLRKHLAAGAAQMHQAVVRKGSRELAEMKRAWAGFVDLLLARAGAS